LYSASEQQRIVETSKNLNIAALTIIILTK